MKLFRLMMVFVFFSSSVMAEPTNTKRRSHDFISTGIILGALSFVASDYSTRLERRAFSNFDASQKAVTWAAYDEFVSRGRSLQASSRRYKDMATYMGLISASMLTAGAIKIAIFDGMAQATVSIKFDTVDKQE